MQLERRKLELAKLEQTEALTADLAASLIILEQKLDRMGGSKGTAGEITTITQNWVQIVRSVSLAANSMAIYSQDDFDKQDDKPITERLVRVPVENGVITNQPSDY